MQIHYNSKTNLLYLRLESAAQQVINKKVTEDIGDNDKIIGIEIMDASKHVNLDKLMPVEFLKAG